VTQFRKYQRIGFQGDNSVKPAYRAAFAAPGAFTCINLRDHNLNQYGFFDLARYKNMAVGFFDVAIEQLHVVSGDVGEIRRDRRLARAAFAAGNSYYHGLPLGRHHHVAVITTNLVAGHTPLVRHDFAALRAYAISARSDPGAAHASLSLSLPLSLTLTSSLSLGAAAARSASSSGAGSLTRRSGTVSSGHNTPPVSLSN